MSILLYKKRDILKTILTFLSILKQKKTIILSRKSERKNSDYKDCTIVHYKAKLIFFNLKIKKILHIQITYNNSKSVFESPMMKLKTDVEHVRTSIKAHFYFLGN